MASTPSRRSDASRAAARWRRDRPVLHLPLPPAAPAAPAVASAAAPVAAPATAAAVAVAVALLRLLRLLDHLAVAQAPELTVQRDRPEVGDLAEGGVVERHVPGRPGRVRPEHLARAQLATAFRPVAGQ